MITYRFKPYYKWITFNIKTVENLKIEIEEVLNLIINGLPSILKFSKGAGLTDSVLNLIINGLPSIS